MHPPCRSRRVHVMIGLEWPSSAFPPHCRQHWTSRAFLKSAAVRIQKRDMIRMLHDIRSFPTGSSHTCSRATSVEEDLVDQVFNSSEKRLARTLLLRRYGSEDKSPRTLPKLSQETAD